MLNDKRSFSQSITYKVIYALSIIAVIVGSIFSFDLYLNEYDKDLAVFDKCSTLYAYIVLSLIMVILVASVLIIPKLFSCAKNEVNNSGVHTLFVNSFTGIFCIAYPLVVIYEKVSSSTPFGKIDFIIVAVAIVASLYFFSNMMGFTEKKSALSIFGMCFAIFCILIIFTVHYSSSEILITSPVRISSMLSYICIMLFVLSEIRFYIGSPMHSMYFSMGFATMFFGITSALPKLYLSIVSENGFEFSSKTILLAIELLCGVYAIARLSGFLSVSKFCSTKTIDDEKGEIYDMITELAVESLENSENNIEHKEEESGNNDYYSENDDLVVSDNDLPEDVGFVGGKEGKFYVEDYESLENDLDDDFEADEMSPFEEESFENSIQEAMDENNADIGELIDYEQIKSQGVDESSENDQVDGESTNNDVVSADEILDDIHENDDAGDDVDDDDEEFDRLLDEIVNKQIAEEEKSRVRFKYKIKKM